MHRPVRIGSALVLLSFCVACGSGGGGGSAKSDPGPVLSDEPVTYGLLVEEDEWLDHISVEPEIYVQAIKFLDSKSPRALYNSAISNLSIKSGECGFGSEGYAELYDASLAPFNTGETVDVAAGVVETRHANGELHAEFIDHTLLYGVVGSYGYNDRHGNGNALPDDLTLNVTGAEFPATFVELPTIPKFNYVRDGQLVAGSAVKWNAFDNGNLPIEISFFTDVVDDDGLQFTTGITCITADDGEFTVPDSVERVDSLTLTRKYVDVQHIDDTAVLTLRTRRWSF